MAGPTDEALELARLAAAEARRHVPVERVVLFGSHATGEAGPDSDIDLAIFSPAIDTMTLEERLGLIRAVHEHVGYQAEVHLFGEEHLREARPTNFPGHILQTGVRVD